MDHFVSEKNATYINIRQNSAFEKEFCSHLRRLRIILKGLLTLTSDNMTQGWKRLPSDSSHARGLPEMGMPPGQVIHSIIWLFQS